MGKSIVSPLFALGILEPGRGLQRRKTKFPVQKGKTGRKSKVQIMAREEAEKEADHRVLLSPHSSLTRIMTCPGPADLGPEGL